jgi:hypothetical protein
MRKSLIFDFIQHVVEHRWEYLSANEGGSLLHAIEPIDLEVHGSFPWSLHHVNRGTAFSVFYVKGKKVMRVVSDLDEGITDWTNQWYKDTRLR